MKSKPVAIVTGGGRGIGRAICLALSRQGYAVVINYARDDTAASETKELLGESPSFTCKASVGIKGDRERMVDETVAQWGRIDTLVNNAAITSPGRPDVLESTEAGWDQVMDVNLKGAFFLTQRVANEMIRAMESKPLHYPSIINIASLSSYAVSTNRGDYCISKAGLSLSTKLWAARLAEYGIRVLEVRPGIIETDLTAPVKEKYDKLIAGGLTPIPRWGQPEDVAKAVAMIASDALPFSTGDAINVDGGFHIARL